LEHLLIVMETVKSISVSLGIFLIFLGSLEAETRFKYINSDCKTIDPKIVEFRFCGFSSTGFFVGLDLHRTVRRPIFVSFSIDLISL
jgi:hypothetical protein